MGFGRNLGFVSAKFPEEEPFYMEATPGSPLPKGKCSKILGTQYGLVQALHRHL
jgi:hypothetical protein